MSGANMPGWVDEQHADAFEAGLAAGQQAAEQHPITDEAADQLARALTGAPDRAAAG